MAQTVKTPRFYVNVFEWLSSNGVLDINDVFRTNPSNFKSYNGSPYSISGETFNDKAFIAILGHTLSSDGYTASLQSDESNLSLTEIVNIGSDQNAIVPEYDGWSLATTDQLNGKEQVADYFTETLTQIGSIILGRYFDMPHSPDLSLTMTREFGGTKTLETRGGNSLSNSFYNGSPNWGDKKAWQLGDLDISVGGRRVWNLSFSYLSDSAVFQDNPSEISAVDGIGYKLGDDTDDFTSSVLKYTQGGQFPFIFQPNGGSSGNNSHDQFAICKFDMDSFQFKQVANSVYNINLKIREVW